MKICVNDIHSEFLMIDIFVFFGSLNRKNVSKNSKCLIGFRMSPVTV